MAKKKQKQKRLPGASKPKQLAGATNQFQKAVQQEAVNMAIEAAAESAVAEAAKAKKASALLAKGAAGLDALYKTAKDKQSRVHVASVDMLGGLSGVLSFEALNWVFRRVAKWSPGFAEDIDYWQSLPHLVIGLVVYWDELLTRKTDASGSKIFPSMPREIASEWAKVFGLLGASNLWRAVRVRRKDTKQSLAELEAMKAERDGLIERLKKYEKPEQKA